MDMVHDISDWVVVMAEGRVIAEGTPDDIVLNPAVIDAYLGAHQGQSLLDGVGERDMTVVLQGTDLVAGYIPEVNILNGCNVVVNEGDFVGIIGPNGAGKSTFLKAVLGLCSVRGGTIELRGEDITGKKAHQLVSMGVGYVPQTKNVFQTLTVRRTSRWGAS